jgi:uncharacterized protein (DUF1778 family)
VRNGRPPKTNSNEWQSLTLRLTKDQKQLLIDMADGYDLAIKDYVMMLAERDRG